MIKANRLAEIAQATQFNVPIGPDHPFFTDFEGLRGEFEEKVLLSDLNVLDNDSEYSFDYKTNTKNKAIIFLGGMRGSGKTSELSKYYKMLNKPNCFFVVTCNIDEELDRENMEYMDILIFQVEKLLKRLNEKQINLNDSILKSLETWFETRIDEINRSLKGEMKISTEYSGGLIGKIIGLVGEIKAGITGSAERAVIIRKLLQNSFGDFAIKFNAFIEESNIAIRSAQNGQEVLFIIDGLEKTFSSATRERILIDESNRISQIKAYTIFTLPIELQEKGNALNRFATVTSFPFVKLIDKDGNDIKDAIDRFLQFVYNRIDAELFESEELVKKMILLSGGSPRQLLSIIRRTKAFNGYNEKMEHAAFEKAARNLSNTMSRFLTKPQLLKLKELNENNKIGEETSFDKVMQELLEDERVMEYNDCTFKRVNPLVEMSKIYKQYVK